MAEFTPKKIELNKINNGQRFRDGDGVSPDAINAPIEAAALLQNLATNAPDNTDANQIGNPQVSIEGEGSNIHFVFKNLKGERGDNGENSDTLVMPFIEQNAERIDRNSNRISNLESRLSDDAFISDSSVVYQKSVPASVAPYAAIEKIGGMTYKDGNTLKHAKVKAIRSESKNLAYVRGWSAYTIASDSDVLSPVNSYGTTLSATEGSTITITQSQYPNTSDLPSYTNGYFALALRNELKEGETYRLSADITVKANPLSADNIYFMANAMPKGKGRLYVSGNAKQRVSATFTWIKNATHSEANFIEFRCCGASFEIGNVMITRADVEDITYSPYGTIDTFTIPEEVQAREGYGAGTLDGNNHIYYGNNGRAYYSKPIKVYEFTGDENWREYNSTDEYFRCVSNALDDALEKQATALCSHLPTGNFANSFSIDGGSSRFSFRFAYNFFVSGETTTEERLAAVIRWLKEQKAQGTPVTIVYALQTPPADEDITDLMPIDNYIKVEGGGTIIADNVYEYDVPTTIKYQKRG